MSQINQNEFVTILANWKKFKQLRDKTSRPFKESLRNGKDLLEFVLNLYEQIVSGSYMPSPPRAYNLIEKGDGTARVVPLLELKDLLVYRFCTMSLEEIIAVNRIPDTFGGWSMGGIIRKEESIELNDIDSQFNHVFDQWLNDVNEDIEYAGFATITPEHWSKNWKEYQRIAYLASEEFPEGIFLQLDLANFYDSIRLDRLESLLRADANSKQQPVVDVLFVFLRYGNRLQDGYSPKTVGIPQDESGDSSRLLANYFLQEYDRYMYSNTRAMGARYIRYADDQIIIGQSEVELRNLVYQASVYLRTIGLSLNGSKTRYSNLEDFHRRWAFELHKDFDINRQGIAEHIVREVRSAEYEWRRESLLKRLLKKGISDFHPDLRADLFSLIASSHFLRQLDSYYFNWLYHDLSQEEWAQLLKVLIAYLKTTLSNQTHLNFMKAMKELNLYDIVDLVKPLAEQRTLQNNLTSFRK